MGPRKRDRLPVAEPLARLARRWRKLRAARFGFRALFPSARRRDERSGTTAAASPTSMKAGDASAVAGARSAYGLIVYEGEFFNNIGDEMQSMAAMRFLPSIDYLIPIDGLTSLTRPAPGSPPVKVIMNGYFTCSPDAWPPPDWIQPLFVSFHLSDIVYHTYPGRGTNPARAATEVLLRGENLAYLKCHEPIGCRDRTTVQRLESAGVQAYFSGCLTLTLTSQWYRSRDKIYIVDVDCSISKLIETVPRRVRDQVEVVTHDLRAPGKMSQIERCASAHELFMMYSSARLVVTSRLHCALPCLAAGTSVLFLKPQVDVSRFAGLGELLNGVTLQDLANGRIDWHAPPPNPTRHLALAEQLRTTCRRFVG